MPEKKKKSTDIWETLVDSSAISKKQEHQVNSSTISQRHDGILKNLILSSAISSEHQKKKKDIKK